MVFLVLAAALGAAMGGCCSASLTETPSVAIFVDFQAPLPDESLSEMQSVVDDAYRDAGLRFQWRALSSFRTGETFPEVVVVKFRGECELKGCLIGWKEPAMTRKLEPLAYAASTDGRVLPFVTVLCRRVLDTIAPSCITLDIASRQKMVGRALGRVVAHELYHVLTRTTNHAKRGLLKPFQTRQDLTGEEWSFEVEQLEILRGKVTERDAAAGGGY